VVPAGEDLRLLDLYERSFLPAAAHVNDIILASTGFRSTAPRELHQQVVEAIDNQGRGIIP
jgi:hypothetical protein